MSCEEIEKLEKQIAALVKKLAQYENNLDGLIGRIRAIEQWQSTVWDMKSMSKSNDVEELSVARDQAIDFGIERNRYKSALEDIASHLVCKQDESYIRQLDRLVEIARKAGCAGMPALVVLLDREARTALRKALRSMMRGGL